MCSSEENGGFYADSWVVPPAAQAGTPHRGCPFWSGVNDVKASQGEHTALMSSVQNVSFTWRPWPEWRFNAGASHDCSCLSSSFMDFQLLGTAGEVEAQEKPFSCGMSGSSAPCAWASYTSMLAGISACPAASHPSHCCHHCGTLRDEAASHVSLLGNHLANTI